MKTLRKEENIQKQVLDIEIEKFYKVDHKKLGSEKGLL